MKVVTYQTPRQADGRINVCEECEARMLAEGWPRGRVSGSEFAEVYMGLHEGRCSVHPDKPEKARD